MTKLQFILIFGRIFDKFLPAYLNIFCTYEVIVLKIRKQIVIVCLGKLSAVYKE